MVRHRRSVRAALLSAAVLTAFAAAPAAAAAADAAADTGKWTNVSAAFFTQLGIAEGPAGAPFTCRCWGMIVSPVGDIVIQTPSQGIAISHDQGATWAVVDDNGINGRMENAWTTSIAYPYDGRMAFFAYDGADGQSGGITIDGGKTWKPFTQYKRGTQYGDVDWGTHDPQVIFSVTHEPFFTQLSTDAGKTWRRLYEEETGSTDDWNVGVVDATHLVRCHRGGDTIELSSDAGVTWTATAYFHVNANAPVHFGRTLYWATEKGVISSGDGATWTLTGPGAENAQCGPYFGATDQECVVVTNTSFIETVDGGKTWKTLAPRFLAPDMFSPDHGYYGWDAQHRCLYASGLGGSVFQLKL